MKLQIKRGLRADLPVLAEGELGFTTDTKALFIGTGNGNVGAPTILGEITPTTSGKTRLVDYLLTLKTNGGYGHVLFFAKSFSDLPNTTATFAIEATFGITVIVKAIDVGSNGASYIREIDTGVWLDAWAKEYNSMNPPAPADIGAVKKNGDTMTGTLKVPGLQFGGSSGYEGLMYTDNVSKYLVIHGGDVSQGNTGTLMIKASGLYADEDGRNLILHTGNISQYMGLANASVE